MVARSIIGAIALAVAYSGTSHGQFSGAVEGEHIESDSVVGFGYQAFTPITSGTLMLSLGRANFLTSAQVARFPDGKIPPEELDRLTEENYQRRKAKTGFDGGWIIDSQKPETWIPDEPAIDR